MASHLEVRTIQDDLANNSINMVSYAASAGDCDFAIPESQTKGVVSLDGMRQAREGRWIA